MTTVTQMSPMNPQHNILASGIDALALTTPVAASLTSLLPGLLAPHGRPPGL